MSAPIDPTARMASNTPLPVQDKRLMDEGIAEKVRFICHIRKTPNVLYGIFLEVTRQMYSDGNGLPIDVCAAWDPDSTKSGIWIDTDYTWEDTTVEKRPAIYIKLGPIAYSSLSGRHDGLYHMDLEQGEYWHTRSGTGTVTWVHIGSTKGETIALMGSTLDLLDAFMEIIRQDFNFHTLELTNCGTLTPEKESKDRYKGIVTATYSFQDTWSIKVESPKLKRIVFSAGQSLLDRGIL